MKTVGVCTKIWGSISCRVVLVEAVLCAVGFVRAAEEIQWNVSHGGDMQIDANWKGGAKPTNSDSISIKRKNDKPITLSENLAATGGNSILSENFELALTNSAGASKTLSLSTFNVGGGSKTIRLTAGTLSFSGRLYMGNLASSYVEDTFLVDGLGTQLSGGAIYIGSKCPNDTLCVTNGATVTATTLDVGRNEFNAASPSTNNCFRVAGAGSRATFSSSVGFGSSGLGRIEVVDGGCLVTTNLYVRHNVNYITIPYYGGNSLLVSGAGSEVVVNGERSNGFWLGGATAPDCSVTVEDKATWKSYGEFKLADGYITNATFRVASGASVTHYIYSLNIGTSDRAVNAALEIDDGTLTSDQAIRVKGDRSHIAIAGADAKISVPSNGINFNPGTHFDVEIPAGGFTGGSAPVTCKTLSIDADATVNVTLDDGWKDVASGNYRIVIAEAATDISETGFTVNLPAASDKLAVTRDMTNARQLAVNVKCKCGLFIIVR